MNIDAATRTYAAEQDAFERARDVLEVALQDMCQAVGVAAAIRGRVKSPSSYLKKMLTRERRGDAAPWSSIDDLLGLRIIVASQPDLRRIRQLLESSYADLEFFGQEDKTALLEPNQLGYRGFHAQILVPDQRRSDGSPIEAEVQLRTQAEDLWNATEHKLNYKGIVTPSPDALRRLMRLSVLTEIFDQEVELVMNAIEADPAYADSRLLRLAETEYHQFVGEPGDHDLSLAVIGYLHSPLSQAAYSEDFGAKLHDFTQHHAAQLRDLYQDFGAGSALGHEVAYWLISQPESLIVLYLLESRRLALARAVRNTELEGVVERLCGAWGVALPELD